MAVIASVAARVINDSRGQPTIEVTVTDDKGRIATASLPSGSSLGKYEAVTQDAQQVVNSINKVIAPALLRQPLTDQATIDAKLRSFDDTANHEKLGVNSLLGISLACARLLAQDHNLSLYHYIFTISGGPGLTIPTPMFNLLNGGKHAENNLDFQEYMVIPIGFKTFHEKLAAGKKVFSALGTILSETGHITKIGAEGGYAPHLSTNEEGLGVLVQAIQSAGYEPGKDFVLGVDVAASALPPTYSATVDNYLALYRNFPLFSLEDPFVEDDWESWAKLKVGVDGLSEPGNPRLLVGDDLFVGNKDRLLEGVKKFSANAVLIKINQAGTLTEIIEAIKIAREHNYVHILSHRSGETLDSFVSDLAIGTAAAFIKAGSANEQAPERIVKYERLVEVEEELNIGHI
ncbi:MAG TPA: phosphopyruvate hydratase [Patescibacteria group bacterium]